MRTQQEFFDEVVKRLTKQGFPCMSNGACTYGLKGDSAIGCAGGIMFSPEYRRRHCNDGGSIVSFVSNEGYNEISQELDFDVSNSDNFNLIRAVQGAHDKASQAELWLSNFLKKMAIIADRYDLEMK